MDAIATRCTIYGVLLVASLVTAILGMAAFYRAGVAEYFWPAAHMSEMVAGLAWAWASFAWALSAIIVCALSPSSRFTSPKATIIAQAAVGVVGIALMGVYSVVPGPSPECHAEAKERHQHADVCNLPIATLVMGWLAVVLWLLAPAVERKLVRIPWAEPLKARHGQRL